MRVVLQRVTQAAVSVEAKEIAAIGRGVLVLAAIAPQDDEGVTAWMAQKIVGLRIFADATGRLAHDVGTVGGSLLLVPQFTLYADLQRGKRPSFTASAPPEQARELFSCFCQQVAQLGIPCAYGRFGAAMQVSLVNDGPMTLGIER